MTKLSFIHLSDIHFVKSSSNPADIDNDLREAILIDLEENAKPKLTNVQGILVTGDIAFSGLETEYNKAKVFLSSISDLFGIQHSDIYCVPGNHDVDQSMVSNSRSVCHMQNDIAKCSDLDSADNVFKQFFNDPAGSSVLFTTIQAYNAFAGRYGCALTSKNITWESLFDLEYDLKLRLFGINSCFLSNKDDHQQNKPDQLMYIGQAQIPKNTKDTATVLMCHHPPECWRYYGELEGRFNARADVQLYGHMHDQKIEYNENNVFLFSGAAHPQRTLGWRPCYNWITFGCSKDKNDRILDIEIYPRVLSQDRSCFLIDKELYKKGVESIKHKINIDDKRRRNTRDPVIAEEILLDALTEKKEGDTSMLHSPLLDDKIDERELVYRFYELSIVKQLGILLDNNLYCDEYRRMQTSLIIRDVVRKARESGQLTTLWDAINAQLNKKGKQI